MNIGENAPVGFTRKPITSVTTPASPATTGPYSIPIAARPTNAKLIFSVSLGMIITNFSATETPIRSAVTVRQRIDFSSSNDFLKLRKNAIFTSSMTQADAIA